MQRRLCTQKAVLNVRFIDFWYTKINDSDLVCQIQLILALKVKNSLLTQNDFLTFNNH